MDRAWRRLSVLSRVIDVYYRILKLLIGVLMGLLIIPVTLQIIDRTKGYLPREWREVWPNLLWTEEVAVFLFIWIIMIGSMVAVRESTHFEVDVLPAPKTPRRRAAMKLVVHLAMMLFALAFFYYGIDFVDFGSIQMSDILRINMLWMYLAVPIAGATWALFLVEHIAADVIVLVSGEEAPQ